MKKDKINKAIETLENMAKASDQGSNPPLNSAEGSDMDVPRGKPMSDEAKAKAKKEKEDMNKKSFAEDLPNEMSEVIDVSDFLKSLVDHTGTKFDELSEHIAKSELASTQVSDEITNRLEGIEKSQAMIGIVLKSLCEKVGVIENTPAHAPKSETSINKSEVADRNFSAPSENATEENQGEPKLFKSLSNNPMVAKSQISDALFDLVKSGDASDTDVINFEMNSYINPTIAKKLSEKLN